ncbi:MAG: response regulator, partial [Desulfuromonadales bacterium]
MKKNQPILIIDDEENLRHMLSVMLSHQGYRVDLAADGEEALGCVLENVYNFILCDIHMPEMDGKTFLVRALEQLVTAPIIMMSAYGSVETAVECLKLG